MKSIQGGGGNGENIEVPKKVDIYYNLNLTLIEVTGPGWLWQWYEQQIIFN